MKDDMQKEAINIAIAASENQSVKKKNIAEYIKKEFDKKHGPTWHCIVGRNFGSYVTHEKKPPEKIEEASEKNGTKPSRGIGD